MLGLLAADNIMNLLLRVVHLAEELLLGNVLHPGSHSIVLCGAAYHSSPYQA
jgi:hypothetical protein